MTVIVVVGSQKVVVSKDIIKNSELFNDMLSCCHQQEQYKKQGQQERREEQDNQQQGEILIQFPSQYDGDVAMIYLSAINGNDYELRHCFHNHGGSDTGKQHTLICLFQLCHFVIDKHMFDRITTMLFDTWFTNYNIIDKLAINIQRDIYIKCPYAFLPKQYQDDMSFVNLWAKQPEGKLIKMNESLVFRSYITLNDRGTHISSVTSWCGSVINHKYALRKHSICRYWYDPNSDDKQQLQAESYFEHDRRVSIYQSWHPNGQIQEIEHYSQDGNSVSQDLFDDKGHLLPPCERDRWILDTMYQ